MFTFSADSLIRSSRGRKAVVITEPLAQITRSRESAENRSITLKLWNITTLPFAQILADPDQGIALVFRNNGSRLPHAVKAATSERGSVNLAKLTVREDSEAGKRILAYLDGVCQPGETVELSHTEATREEREYLYGENGVLTPLVGTPINPAELTVVILTK